MQELVDRFQFASCSAIALETRLRRVSARRAASIYHVFQLPASTEYLACYIRNYGSYVNAITTQTRLQ